jgi:glycosyltransferase involved in cell wall biosynthesis
MSKELSIVIPTLNEEHYLPNLLEDLNLQKYRDFEVIVSDGNSDDQTAELARIKGCKVVVSEIRSEFVQRNEGAKVASGKFLLFLDADNRLYSENFISNVVEEFRSNDLAVASFILKYDSTKLKYKMASMLYNITSFLGQYIYPITMTGILTTKELHDVVGGFEQHRLGGDHAYSRRLIDHGKYMRIKSAVLYTSVRRFEREGLVKVHMKWIKTAIYRIFGVKDDVVEYEFGDY